MQLATFEIMVKCYAASLDAGRWFGPLTQYGGFDLKL